jgi:DUF3102 family protein
MSRQQRSPARSGERDGASADKRVAEIARLHQEILAAARTSVEKAIRIGELLTAAKSKLRHGEWLPWLRKNVVFSERTARNYMRCFESRDLLKSATLADLTDAYRLLCVPTITETEHGGDDKIIAVKPVYLAEAEGFDRTITVAPEVRTVRPVQHSIYAVLAPEKSEAQIAHERRTYLPHANRRMI